MSSLRFQSLETVLGRDRIQVKPPSDKISDFFSANVYHENAMKKHMSEEAYLSVKASIRSGQKIDRKIADQVASSMKAWAMAKGATHYTHWFQPLTGSTAEKHDSFFVPTDGGKGIENFSGNALVQQEPDASSFPSGGLRQTFEARGYTAWDPSSPAFIMEIDKGRTLCIPTIFVSYTGEALDFKAPLLKSVHALEEAALDVMRSYFDKKTSKVTPTLGWEQEYFLVDEALFKARPDLAMAGRTVFGHTPAKGQQLEDHYFGSIPERVYAYMVDMETEALKLGIPVRTRHNEVAPSQFEAAPMFEEVNLAVDHNQLMMDVMDRVARRHKLRVLLHEKPYAGINGSGKHNNWSMGTDTGINLLSPGNTPKTNLRFLTFFVNTVRAVYEHSDLIRAAIAAASNDHRLGANEAPPAIISVFLGSEMTSVLDEIEQRAGKDQLDKMTKEDLKLDIHNKIPDLLLDNTDRNRTSPFAFTGNKFEVRAVGSSANCASIMTVLNTMVADQLRRFVADVEVIRKEGEDRDVAILRVLSRYIKEARPIMFEGDNYSEEWAQEAARRGLNNVKTTPQALDFYMTEKARDLFIRHKIFTDREMHARHEIWLDDYTRKIQIEARLMGELGINFILPAAVKYQNTLLENVRGLRELGMPAESYAAQSDLIGKINHHINGLKSGLDQMVDNRRSLNKIEDPRERAIAYCDKVTAMFPGIREHADKLERFVDDAHWPLPKYRELLFIR
ncbi:MAG: glutamine synthetase type III [Bacteroidetes bacterium]|nr:glutamine synthetase type III [Bacteroidota bacterium]